MSLGTRAITRRFQYGLAAGVAAGCVGYTQYRPVHNVSVMAASAKQAATSDGQVIAINLRDIGEISPNLAKGVVYRCSQVYNDELLKKLKIKTIVDLRGRQGKRAKKKAAEAKARAAAGGMTGPTGSTASLAESTMSDTEGDPTTAPQFLEDDELERIRSGAAEESMGSIDGAAYGPVITHRRHDLVAIHRSELGSFSNGANSNGAGNGAAPAGGLASLDDALPAAGEEPKQRSATTEELTAALADPSHLNFNLIPTKEFGWKVLRFPKRVWFQAVGNLVTGKDARKPFVDAFADEQVLGFTKYYILMLEHAKKHIASVLRVFKDPANLPALIHCAHGKDRTGVVIMLLLMICGVPAEEITADYIQSEQQLRAYRESLGLDNQTGASALIPLNDVIIASTQETIRAVHQYVLTNYITVENYLHSIGLTATEIEEIKKNIMSPAGTEATKGAEGTPVVSALRN